MAELTEIRGDEALEKMAVLGADGRTLPGERVSEPPELLLEMYRWMVFGRALDTRLFNLQRQGRVATYAPYAGQEAAEVGCAMAMQPSDWLLPTYRDGLACTVHGRPVEHLIFYFTGHPKTGAVPADVNVCPPQVGIAEHIPHSVGIAWGMKLRGAGTAAVAMFGDGATSEGAFHEACNFAGVLKAPVVLFCQNNGWAISVPRSRQTASATLADKDVIAVYRAVTAALERARAGDGPTLIEAVTYRIGPHTTSDDPTRYRPADEQSAWQHERDPLARLRAYLEREGLWDDARQQALDEESRERVARAVTGAMNEPAPPPEAIFDHIYAEPTAVMAAQRDELLAHLKAQNVEGHHA
jgi:TPP-dependent pyruvate/acetoin dehydrogenase alpha subunit